MSLKMNCQQFSIFSFFCHLSIGEPNDFLSLSLPLPLSHLQYSVHAMDKISVTTAIEDQHIGANNTIRALANIKVPSTSTRWRWNHNIFHRFVSKDSIFYQIKQQSPTMDTQVMCDVVVTFNWSPIPEHISVTHFPLTLLTLLLVIDDIVWTV